MKIQDVRLYILRAPLRTPFKTALRTVDRIEDLVVAVETDTGETGWGEAPATAPITGDTLHGIACAVRDHIAPRIRGLEIERLEQATDAVQNALVHNTSAKAAVDIALHDLYGKRWGAPLWSLLGGWRSEVETDVTISLNDPATMERDARQAIQDGFRILKVKVGTDAEDLRRVEVVRQAAGPDAVIRVDANQGWTPKQAVRLIWEMEARGLEPELVEQPVPAADLEGLKFVTDHVRTDILADEAVFGLRDAVRLIRMRAADRINLKLMKTGGITGAVKICALAEEFGIRCMMGCMLEANVAVTAAAHLAAAKKNISLSDLDGPALCAADPVRGGARFEGGRITLPNAPGLGIARIEGLVPYPG